jgi:glycosyltransferase involved in cell wall biosynthesis
MNSPDEEIFQYREPSPGTAAPRPPTKPFVIMYHGSLVERHGLDLAITALAEILDPIPGAQLRIFGSTTPYMTKVLDSITDPRLRAAVHFLGPKNLGELVKEIGECDVGVIPNRRSIFTEINTPTRIFEYLSQGKPTIAPRAPGILDYFGPDDLIYFELGDAADLAQKLQYVFSNPEAVARTVQRGQRIFREHSWSSERQRLLDTVAQILPPPAGAKTGGSR